MSRTCYINGQYKTYKQGSIHVEDRGFQFADSIYEVCAVSHGAFLDLELHLDRMERSLKELRIAHPVKRNAFIFILNEVRRRNKVENGIVYFQITRGVAPRDHKFPQAQVKPTLVITAKKQNTEKLELMAERGISVITTKDIRWGRCDIKTTSLIANVLAKQCAFEQEAQEAIFVDSDDYVREGSSSNFWIVDKDKNIRTRPLDAKILGGVTRHTVLKVADELGYNVIEGPVSLGDVAAAKEIFVTSATLLVQPVTSFDGRQVSNGAPGLITTELREAYKRAVLSETARDGMLN